MKIRPSDNGGDHQHPKPGNYKLKVDVREKPSTGVGPSRTPDPFNAALTASLSLDLTVPESSNGADKPIELGILELKPAEENAGTVIGVSYSRGVLTLPRPASRR